MQWDDSENAGFTSGNPWLRVNPNYVGINAADQVNRKDFVLPEIFKGAERVISNYEEIADFNLLRPYEAYALSIT